MGGTFTRWHEQFNVIRKDNQADLVIVLDSREGNEGTEFRRHLIFHAFRTAEGARGREVHQEHHGQFAFFDEALHVGVPHAGGNIPVDRAHLVAELVFTHLVKLHTTALEDTMVFPGKRVIDGFAGVDLEVADFFRQLFGNHGTLTDSRMRVTMSSEVFSSASAS